MMNGIQNNFSLFFSYFIVHKSKYVIVFLRQKFGTISIFKLSVSQITLTVRNFNFLDLLFYFLLDHAAIVAPMRHGRRTAMQSQMSFHHYVKPGILFQVI